MMKKFLALIFSTMISFSAAQADELTVAFLSDVPPFGFVKDGKNTGFDLDVWSEIAKDLKLDYKPVYMDFVSVIPALQTRSLDVALTSMFITEPRKQTVDFSDPYYYSAFGILVHKDDESVKEPKDLAGKTVAAVTGGTGPMWLKENLPDAKVALLPNLPNAILEFQSGRADAVIYDFPTIAYYAQTDGAQNSRVLKQEVGERYEGGIAFPKGSPLVAKVNKTLAAMRADGRYDAVYKKWFGAAPTNN
ncbi:transporter substrate-binding domain-containing protein [Brucella pseudogrignonensis]|uniref:transporter substrate-binding domain-containing protein n=1 Tax=Brucella pseudogrignonensis TaxID=419475 RepID=UPI003D9516D3